MRNTKGKNKATSKKNLSSFSKSAEKLRLTMEEEQLDYFDNDE